MRSTYFRVHRLSIGSVLWHKGSLATAATLISQSSSLSYSSSSSKSSMASDSILFFLKKLCRHNVCARNLYLKFVWIWFHRRKYWKTLFYNSIYCSAGSITFRSDECLNLNSCSLIWKVQISFQPVFQTVPNSSIWSEAVPSSPENVACVTEVVLSRKEL